MASSSADRSSYTYSNIQISGSSSVHLGSYHGHNDSSQRQPMEQLLRIFNKYLECEDATAHRPAPLSYIGELQNTLIDRAQDFIRVLEEQIERSEAGKANLAAVDLISELELLVAKLQKAQGEKRGGATSNLYHNITITGGTVHAGNRWSPAVPVYTYQLRKALKDYFKSQGREDLLAETSEEAAGLPIRAAATKQGNTEADDGSATTTIAASGEDSESSKAREKDDWLVVDAEP